MSLARSVVDRDEAGPRRTVRRFRFRITAILVVVALLPLGGAGLLVARNVSESRALSSDAGHVQASTARLVALTDLEAALIDEKIWVSAVALIKKIGVSLERVKQAVNLDILESRSEAIDRVDALLATVDLARLAAPLAEVRSADLTLSELDRAYGVLQSKVEEVRKAEFATVGRRASNAAGSYEMSTAVEVLEFTSQARQALMVEVMSYITALFGARDNPAVELQNLIHSRDTFVAKVTEIEATVASSSPIALRLRSVRRNETLTPVQRIIDATIDKAATTPLAAGKNILDDPALVAEATVVLKATEANLAAYSSLMTLASADVGKLAVELRDSANTAVRLALMLVLGLVAVSLALCAVVARAITRPLHQLELGAKALQNGDSSYRIEPVGPSEVQAAATAINDAAAHLDLAERQARALAAGDLTAMELAEAGPGVLGTSLQTAVQTLTASLAEREEFRKRLAHEATHDGLTRMPNRTASMRELGAAVARAGRSKTQVAVLFLDLDAFKPVNDVHGHQAGDAVLVEVGRRLGKVIRQGDHVGRLGGDEFLIIAEPVSGPEDAIDLSRRLLAAIVEPIAIGETTVTVGASIGIALASDDSLSAEELLRDADLAVYKAKAGGRGTYELCDETLRAQRIEHADFTLALRKAITNDELLLFYQPIISHGTGELHAIEALVRWERPGQGMLFPDDFIPFAERSDLIIDLDRWVLDAVAAQLAEWSDDPLLGDIPVAINVSGRHLSSDLLLPNVRSALQGHDIDPSRVIIEVTESAVLDDLGAVAVKIQELRRLGIRVAVDDFGTGFTSLAHLRTLPIDILKIDRSFTVSAGHDRQAEAIVRLIVDIGHLLGARITAEGIETTEQATQLVGLGTDELQGYLYAIPGPAETLKATIAKYAGMLATQ